MIGDCLDTSCKKGLAVMSGDDATDSRLDLSHLPPKCEVA